ncbi:glycerophosphodiester phosphodiesterase [Litoribacter alkaliphilus]|uniref:Glycerophosphodiester phosphodiesterase n=1 Tax=Litoribacter ruber TaxID=702568 RepID=A0AAP2CEQ0_9BACT|nr:glycerophosphodiester phosphodiesterase family protein [Litoribacter alkaliphilus]MBS9523008.1 glycerophosphodiester phosphodiesterase [Litoribacter alkaliphilus]
MHTYSILLLLLIGFSFSACQQDAGSEFHKNKVIAHRGAWKNAGHPQNSLASLREAIKLGCEGSEFDVWMTADSILVVNHDPDFMGMSIETSTLEQLYEKELPNGERIPTAEEYLKEGIKQKKTKLIFEAKPSELGVERSVLLAEKSVELVKRLDAQDWVDYISFEKAICRKIIELDPMARVAYLNGEKSPQELADKGYYGFDYHISVVKKNPEWITQAHQLSLTVNAWTVNNPEDMNWLLDHNTDFITTDEPEMLLEIVQKRD